MERLKDVLERHHGQYTAKLAITIEGKGRVVLQLPDEYNTSIDSSLAKDVETILGYQAVSVLYA